MAHTEIVSEYDGKVNIYNGTDGIVIATEVPDDFYGTRRTCVVLTKKQARKYALALLLSVEDEAETLAEEAGRTEIAE
jgi:hypothetical protein